MTLWHADLLLENDHKISSYTTAIARQWLCKQWLLLGNGRFITCNNEVTGKQCSLCSPCDSYVMQQQKNCWERCILCGQCWGYMRRSTCDYNRILRRQQEECEMVASLGVSHLEQWMSCEAVASHYGFEHGSWGSYSIGSVTRQQPVKIQQTEKTSYVL
jgi:hypothetical protein